MYSDKSKGNVLILAEYAGKEIDSITAQLIVKGRELAEKMGVAVDALLLGNGLEQHAQKLCKMGVERVLLIDHVSLQLYNPQLYPRVIAGLIKDLMPSVFLLGYTYWGMVVGPAVAARLRVRLFTNCLDVELTEDMVRVTRPMFRGLTIYQGRSEEVDSCRGQPSKGRSTGKDASRRFGRSSPDASGYR